MGIWGCPKISLLAAVAGLAVTSLAVAVAVEGKKLAEMEARLHRVERQDLQLTNDAMRGREVMGREMAGLFRELQALKGNPARARADLGPPPGSDDAERLQGEWEQVRVEHNGAPVKFGDQAARVHLFVEGRALRMEVGGEPTPQQTVFAIDPFKATKEMEAKALAGRARGSVRKGIYRIEGDVWTYCLGPADGDRPKTFESPARSDTYLCVWKRFAAPRPHSAS